MHRPERCMTWRSMGTTTHHGQSSTGIFTRPCAKTARRQRHTASRPRFTEKKPESGFSSTCTLQKIASRLSGEIAKELKRFVGGKTRTHSPALKPPPRKAEPRLGAVIAELGPTQFDDFQSWFDGQRHLPGRPARR